ncbi:hypothetical protein [Hyphomicrobium sp.]|uniref:hypothetical protein n=1 Tax=Hyphomicrobium sp. TaxID=82 RepID=UPI0025C10ABF|nr:hypothetical protein [Hyphomicrobium sp.]MCC7253322.1 hypothetical protein [Hyphomicrobium sp.]
MRALILALALLAGTKIWIQDHIYRTAADEAIVVAYRALAADACTSASPDVAAKGSTGWSSVAEPRVAVGNPALPVRFWEFDHALWNARFRQPYLVLSLEGAACTYDILAGTAAITHE